MERRGTDRGGYGLSDTIRPLSALNNEVSSVVEEEGGKVHESEEDEYEDAREQQEDVSWIFLVSFLFISLGYMLPWTALGSLITYYKYTYSASFYVKIYCAYYLPGLPISILQFLYGEQVDGYYGSQNTFLLRGILGYSILVITLFSLLWVNSEAALVAAFSILGVSGWWLHGTASMLTSMFPRLSIAYLQIGFRCPEIYAVIADGVLDLGKDATQENLGIFYKATSMTVLICLSFWILVVGSSTATKYFNEKDLRIRRRNSQRFDLITSKATALESALNKAETYSLISHASAYEYEEIDGSSDMPQQLIYDNEWEPIRSNSHVPPLSSAASHTCSRSKNLYQSAEDWPSCGAKIAYYFCILPSNVLSRYLQRMFSFMYKDDSVFAAVCPLCVALMITMWSSIFQASFFAYVESKKGRDIEQILYFTRLFSDLLGRPLTFLPRPKFIRVCCSEYFVFVC